MSIENKIRSYILENYMFTDDDSQLPDHGSFLEQGIVDSTGMMEIIYFLEDEFGIAVEEDEMRPENLDSVARIASYIRRKQEVA
jgi:acyl carrier protein